MGSDFDFAAYFAPRLPIDWTDHGTMAATIDWERLADHTSHWGHSNPNPRVRERAALFQHIMATTTPNSEGRRVRRALLAEADDAGRNHWFHGGGREAYAPAHAAYRSLTMAANRSAGQRGRPRDLPPLAKWAGQLKDLVAYIEQLPHDVEPSMVQLGELRRRFGSLESSAKYYVDRKAHDAYALVHYAPVPPIPTSVGFK